MFQDGLTQHQVDRVVAKRQGEPITEKVGCPELHVLEVQDPGVGVAPVASADVDDDGIGREFGEQLGEPGRVGVAAIHGSAFQRRRILGGDEFVDGVHDHLVTLSCRVFARCDDE